MKGLVLLLLAIGAVGATGTDPRNYLDIPGVHNQPCNCTMDQSTSYCTCDYMWVDYSQSIGSYRAYIRSANCTTCKTECDPGTVTFSPVVGKCNMPTQVWEKASTCPTSLNFNYTVFLGELKSCVADVSFKYPGAEDLTIKGYFGSNIDTHMQYLAYPSCTNLAGLPLRGSTECFFLTMNDLEEGKYALPTKQAKTVTFNSSYGKLEFLGFTNVGVNARFTFESHQPPSGSIAFEYKVFERDYPNPTPKKATLDVGTGHPYPKLSPTANHTILTCSGLDRETESHNCTVTAGDALGMVDMARVAEWFDISFSVEDSICKKEDVILTVMKDQINGAVLPFNIARKESCLEGMHLKVQATLNGTATLVYQYGRTMEGPFKINDLGPTKAPTPAPAGSPDSAASLAAIILGVAQGVIILVCIAFCLIKRRQRQMAGTWTELANVQGQSGMQMTQNAGSTGPYEALLEEGPSTQAVGDKKPDEEGEHKLVPMNDGKDGPLE